MSSDIRSIKAALVTLLKADTTLQTLLGTDARGNRPVYHTFIEATINKPCITVEDITDTAQVSGLKDSYDGAKRYQWQFAVIQVDCWSGKGADERDQIENAVLKCILKNGVSGSLYFQEPAIVPMDEPSSKPPLWRKCLRFHAMYVLEVAA